MPTLLEGRYAPTVKEADNFAELMAFLGVEIEFDLLDFALEDGSIMSYEQVAHLMYAIVYIDEEMLWTIIV